MLINLLTAYYIRAAQVMKRNSLGTVWLASVPDRVCKIKCGREGKRAGGRKKGEKGGQLEQKEG
jgi:hypothetical protein